MAKKQKRSREETSAEGYFPVDEEDLKHTTEKIIKETNIELPKNRIEKIVRDISKDSRVIEKKYHNINKKDIEKIEEIVQKSLKSKKRKSSKTRKTRTTTKEIKYLPPKINLKEKGYELIITEKPQAAAKIASALGTPTKNFNQKIPYYEVTKNSKKIIIVSAVGHLFTLSQKKNHQFPVFDITWKPNSNSLNSGVGNPCL